MSLKFFKRYVTIFKELSVVSGTKKSILNNFFDNNSLMFLQNKNHFIIFYLNFISQKLPCN